MSIITVDDVTKTYGDNINALDGISIEIERGEFYGFLGKNGAGKTTLINILTGQVAEDSGTVEVLSRNPSIDGETLRETMGILPEKEVPPSFLTPNEYFDFVGDIRGLNDETVHTKVSEWADRLDITEKLDTMNRTLSRGQQQKVMLTAAFLHEPELVFIDEPLANLDPIVQEDIKEYFKQYHADGNTIILSTHYTEAAEELCSRVGIIDNGQLVTERDTETLSENETLKDILLETEQ